MTHKDLKKLLQKAGIGGMFGRGIRLFDTGYAEATFIDMLRRVKDAKGFLNSDGLQWRETIADCDNFSLWYVSEITKIWALEHNDIYHAYPFGRAHMKGHDTNIGIADGEIYFWDYGELKYFDPKTIDEAEFR